MERNPSEEASVSDGEVERLKQKIEELRGEKDRLDLLLKDVLDSHSWRLTAPLRRAIALKRRLWPLLCFRRYRATLASGRAASVSAEGRVLVDGQSPQIEVRFPDGRTPRGWVCLEGQLRASDKGHQFFHLYERSSTGDFSGDRRHWLSFESTDDWTRTLIHLKSDVAALRLDPFEEQADFKLENLTFRELGSLQTAWHMVARQLKGVRLNPRIIFSKFRTLVALFREGGLTAIRVKLFASNVTGDYQEWVRRYDTLTPEDLTRLQRAIEAFRVRPTISVIMPVYNTPKDYLEQAIASVEAQVYPNWELCIADDCSTMPEVRAVLEAAVARCPEKIKVVYRTEQGHIAAASSSALAQATGEFIALLDHDDMLTPHALCLMVERLQTAPDANLLYSDEDKITSFGMRFNPYFKPDWNPELLRVQNYICHFTMLRTELVRAVGGFRPGFDGAQDWDLFLRVADQSTPDKIQHVARVLYHWRVIEGSTAQSTSYKPYVLDAQKRTVEEHLTRKGLPGAEVTIRRDISHLRVRLPLPAPAPLVSIIIPTRNQVGYLERCVRTLRAKTTYKTFEIIVVDNGSDEAATRDYLDKAQRDGLIHIHSDSGPFNFSRLNNGAVQAAAKGDLLLFLNNDIEILDGAWLDEMVRHAVQPEIGAVGARLLYPNRGLQHGGVILGIGGVAGHNHKGIREGDPGYFNRAILTHSLSAVTAACLLMRRAVFDEVGGFDQEGLSVAFNDIDLCLKVRAQGYRVVYCAEAVLIHHESVSRGYETTPQKFRRFEQEIVTMKERWGAALKNDPCYNPNLTLHAEDFSFAFPPRVMRLERSGS